MDLTGEFTLDAGITYLNTASAGVGPRRAADVLRTAVTAWSDGSDDWVRNEAVLNTTRATYARLTGVPADRVAVGSSVTTHVGMIAAGLPAGAEVVLAEGDFSSLVNPFASRPDLAVRTVPLEGVADAVRPGTALVAVSAVQSADGRVADLAAVREAAGRHGARVLVDATQAVGWLPLTAGAYDYVVCGGYKWLLAPRGVSFLTVREGAEDGLSPHFAGWYAAEDPWGDCYGPVARLARSARRFDVLPPFLPYLAGAASLGLIEEVGVGVIGAHDTALAERFRAGLRELGHKAVPPGAHDSAIVAVPGLGDAAERLAAAGIRLSVRAGNLRAAFHLYNTEADVDLLLRVLAR
ncbi:aminotransferase class V-fold PLP-dependent enzyme [Streptomyces sp. NPDC046977]|uniref:aminotransferase class V-fold PLP-dependent enzyme n=1 Tax=Streptomyces sp. NPDC046977 TaxID=3154703 RepID=UPI0033C74E3B